MKSPSGLLIAAAISISSSILSAQDTLFMNSGERRVGKIMAVDPAMYRLQVPLASRPGEAPILATVTIPRADVQSIEFFEDPATSKLFSESAQLTELQAAWQKWEPFLKIPKSPAGRIGNVYGDLLLLSGTDSNARTALDLFTLIEQTAWAEDARMQAKQGRLRAMIATGNAAAAINDALALAKISEDPAVLVEAKYILAEAADKGLRKLLEDNPRWKEDIFVIPERHRLYNEALDEYLYPYLFFGSNTEEAARGLWGAIGVYQLTGESAPALECARDLLRLYPKSKYAARAKVYVASLPEAQLAIDPEKEVQAENAPAPSPNSNLRQSTKK
jgi:hypothetical protein